MSVINRIISLLKENDITARKLTMDLDLANSSISEWKKGKAKPSIDAVIKIAKYFGVTTDYLLMDDDSCDMVTPLNLVNSTETGTNADREDYNAAGMEQKAEPEIREEKDKCVRASHSDGLNEFTREDKELLDYYHKLDEKDKQYIWCKIVVLEREYSE